MTFLSPVFFWSFLSLIPLAAIYFLKVRPRRKPTTAYFLWQKIFNEKRATSLFNRLRDVLSLLLLLLAFSAIAVALTQPEFTDDERKDLLILIDRSASMSADDGGETRLEKARETAADIVTALNGAQRAAVATIDRDISFLSHLSNEPRLLLDAVEGVEPSDFAFRVEAIKSLARDAHWSASHRILLLSDGCFEVTDLPANVELLKIGAPAGNAGIVAADLQRLPSGDLGFYFRVASSFEEPVTADLILTKSETEAIAKLIPLTIQPGDNPAEIFDIPDGDAGEWTARLELKEPDALDKDNAAYLAVPEPQPVKVQVDTEDRYFLETSVLAFERGTGLLKLSAEDPDIVLTKADGSEGERIILFQPGGESPWWESLGEEIQAVAPRVVIEDHPVLRHTDLASLAFIGAREIRPIEGAVVILESENGVPLVYRANREGRSAIVVNMDPVASEFYFSAWFPVLIHSAATHLAGREESLVSVYQPGDTVPIPGYREGNSATVSLPLGEPIKFTGREFGPVERLGFYGFENTSGNWPVGVSLMARPESLLDNEAIAETAAPVAKGVRPAYWLIVVALIVVTAESLLYHRRKVG